MSRSVVSNISALAEYLPFNQINDNTQKLVVIKKEKFTKKTTACQTSYKT